MKNVLKAFGVIAFMAVIGFSFAACGGGGGGGGGSGGVSVPSQLVGEWNSSDGQDSIIIKSDGEINSLRLKLFFFILPSSTLGQTSGTIVFGYSEMLGESGRFSYSVSGNTMTISNSDYYDFPNGTYTRESGSNNQQTATYTGTASDTTYTLKTTGNTSAPQSGDAYVLTVGTKTSTGTVSGVSGGVLTLKPSNAANTFTATVSGSSLTALNGTITWTDNTTASAPGAFTSSTDPGTGSGGTLTITDIPQEYNGKFIASAKYEYLGDTETQKSVWITVYAAQSITGFYVRTITASKISNGSASIPMWLDNGNRYTLNTDKIAFEFFITENQTYEEGKQNDQGKCLVYTTWWKSRVTFSNGSATMSWNNLSGISYY